MGEMLDIKDLFKYNWFCRRKFLKSMAEIPWETVTENCGASFDSIRNIFIHSLQAEQFSIRLLSRKSIKEIWETPFSKFASIKDIQEYADKIETETNEYLTNLSEQKLNSIFEFEGWDKKTHRHKVEDMLMHTIEEEIHHRGELLCIFWQYDIEPPWASYTSYKGEA
jgi:uncharacterized damage-inducible protein DinB